MLLEKSGEKAPEGMKRLSQSRNDAQWWMCLVVKVKSDAVKTNIAKDPGMLGQWIKINSVQFSSVQSLRHVWLFATPWTAACQASLPITNSQSLLRLMCFKTMMSSYHLILCHPLLFLPSIFPSISVFSNETVLRIRWPKYWNFSFSISTFNE